MRFYKLKALSVGAKGNRVLRKEDNKTYPEDTWHEKRAEELVALGFLIRVKEDPEKAEPEDKIEPEKEKPGTKESGKDEKEESPKKEESILDSIIDAGGEEDEEGAEAKSADETPETEEETTPEADEKSALLKEAKKLAKEKGIRAPHHLSGIEKLKTFINDNK